MRKTHMWLLLPALLFTSLVSWPLATVQAEEKHSSVVIAAMVYGKHNIITFEGFKTGMEEKGFIEGRNTTYLFDGPYQTIKDLDGGMARLMARNPDLIFAATTPVTLAAKKATTTNKVPVVFGPVNDPVRSGIVNNRKQPGDNITGVTLTDSTAKQLEWAVRLSPQAKTFLLPYNPNDNSSLISLQKVKEAVGMLGLELVVRATRSHAEIDALLAACPDNIDAIFLPRDAMIMSRVEDFAKVAREQKLVLSGTRLEMAARGALFGFGFNGFQLGRQMSRLADQILRGKNPGDLPVETAEDYLSINLKAAHSMGITISEQILRQAHTIIRPE